MENRYRPNNHKTQPHLNNIKYNIRRYRYTWFAPNSGLHPPKFIAFFIKHNRHMKNTIHITYVVFFFPSFHGFS